MLPQVRAVEVQPHSHPVVEVVGVDAYHAAELEDLHLPAGVSPQAFAHPTLRFLHLTPPTDELRLRDFPRLEEIASSGGPLELTVVDFAPRAPSLLGDVRVRGAAAQTAPFVTLTRTDGAPHLPDVAHIDTLIVDAPALPDLSPARALQVRALQELRWRGGEGPWTMIGRPFRLMHPDVRRLRLDGARVGKCRIDLTHFRSLETLVLRFAAADGMLRVALPAATREVTIVECGLVSLTCPPASKLEHLEVVDTLVLFDPRPTSLRRVLTDDLGRLSPWLRALAPGSRWLSYDPGPAPRRPTVKKLLRVLTAPGGAAQAFELAESLGRLDLLRVLTAWLDWTRSLDSAFDDPIWSLPPDLLELAKRRPPASVQGLRLARPFASLGDWPDLRALHLDEIGPDRAALAELPLRMLFVENDDLRGATLPPLQRLQLGAGVAFDLHTLPLQAIALGAACLPDLYGHPSLERIIVDGPVEGVALEGVPNLQSVTAPELRSPPTIPLRELRADRITGDLATLRVEHLALAMMPEREDLRRLADTPLTHLELEHAPDPALYDALIALDLEQLTLRSRPFELRLPDALRRVVRFDAGAGVYAPGPHVP